MPKGTKTRATRRREDRPAGGLPRDPQWVGTVVHSHVAPAATHPDARLVRPLRECLPAGRRDALSLLGQYAAYLGFLRFAGIGNAAFDIQEWGLMKERGRDPRLVRRAGGRVSESDEMLPVTLLEQFAEVVGAPRLEALRRSWVRPEVVYAEVLERLGEVAGDTSSLRRAAWGAIRSPGPAILHELLTQRGVTVLADEDAAKSARAMGEPFTILGDDVNPLESWSGVRNLIRDDRERRKRDVAGRAHPGGNKGSRSDSGCRQLEGFRSCVAECCQAFDRRR